MERLVVCGGVVCRFQIAQGKRIRTAIQLHIHKKAIQVIDVRDPQNLNDVTDLDRTSSELFFHALQKESAVPVPNVPPRRADR